MRRALAWVASSVLALAPRAAAAEPGARLVYLRSADAQSCPSEDVLRAAVVARVGRDPFVAGSPRAVTASLTRHGRTFVANVDLVDERGADHAHELSTDGACDELLAAVALAIVIAIDPRVLVAPPPAAQPPSPPPPPPPPPPPEAAPPPVPLERGSVDHVSLAGGHRAITGVDASVGLLSAAGEAPSPSAAVALGAAFHWGLFSLGVEGQLNAPASTSVAACGVAQLGAMEASSSGVTYTRSESLAWRAVGGRLGLVLPLRGGLLLRIHGDVLADVDRTTFRLDGAEAWRAPGAAGVLGADAVVHFR